MSELLELGVRAAPRNRRPTRGAAMLRTVVLGPHDPTWKKLYEALASLAVACGGMFAFVIDEGNGLWCVGLADSGATTSTADEDRAAGRFYEREMVPRREQLRRGKRL